MAKSKYSSEFPEVVIDKQINSVNGDMKMNITVEQWYDMLHHTHVVNDIVDESGNPISGISGGSSGGGASSADLTEIKSQITALQSSISSLQTEINSLKSDVSSIDGLDTKLAKIDEIDTKLNEIGDISTQLAKIDTLDTRVTELEDNDIVIDDWDVKTPGIQDINGNTIG